MSTALASQNGSGLKKTLAVDTKVESVGSMDGQAGSANLSWNNVREARRCRGALILLERFEYRLLISSKFKHQCFNR